MKIRLSLVILVFGLLLAACSSAKPGPGTTTATTAPTAAEVEQESPTLEEIYPNPQALEPVVEPTFPSDAYPAPGEGQTVEWDAAKQMILNGEVARVSQQNDLTVTLTLKDGRTVTTVEPTIDEVLKVIEQCGDPCKDIEVVTE